jgi:hypothetical protein
MLVQVLGSSSQLSAIFQQVDHLLDDHVTTVVVVTFAGCRQCPRSIA